jgi:hypothetical protein
MTSLRSVVHEKGAYLSCFFVVQDKMSKIADDPRKVKRKTAAVSELVGALSDIAPVPELFKHPYEQDCNRPSVYKQTPAQKHNFVEELRLNSRPCSTMGKSRR